MVSPLQQNPTSFIDSLYCEEEHFDEDPKGIAFEEENELQNNLTLKKSVSLVPDDLLWEDIELVSLFAKEKETHFSGDRDLSSDGGSLMVVRKEGVGWMLRVNAYYGFNAKTAVLAVNYFDRFISNLCFQRDKPWMSQLAAVTCLSLAAKVEETHVPLLLDLQVEESKFVFEAKTIQRMELLVLSTLQWRMNPVTPLSFIDHIVRRFVLNTGLNWEFMRKCECLLLYVISDSSFVCYSPSVIAAVTMLLVIKEFEHCGAMEYDEDKLSNVLNISKEKVNDCYKLFKELLEEHEESQTHKRKYRSRPGSPNGVIDAYFSSDSSNDSWAVALSVSSSPEPLYKKSRGQDQLMRLAPVNRVSLDVLSSPP